MVDRLLFESDVVNAISQYITDHSCAELSNVLTGIIYGLPSAVTPNLKSEEVENRIKTKSSKEKRVELYEDGNIVLERRGNKYYLSLYDHDGKYQREVMIDVKDDYTMALANYK